MTKITNNPITAAELTAEFMRLRRGSVTRRHFLGVTGLGLAAAVMGRTGAFSLDAHAQDLGSQMSLATWPNCQLFGIFGQAGSTLNRGMSVAGAWAVTTTATISDAAADEISRCIAGILFCAGRRGSGGRRGSYRRDRWDRGVTRVTDVLVQAPCCDLCDSRD